ncbi:MAG TPA: hypothetical protein VI791_00790 [Patescibacteria group bacterium]|nr:hypothetical protein [Patescibacteria group bacterium]
MLDKNDLKQIDNLLVKRIGEELKPIIEDIGLLKKELRPIKEDISHIRKDMKTVINYFDREYLQLRKRVERIEAHLNLSVS